MAFHYMKLQNALAEAKEELPKEAGEPIIIEMDVDTQPTLEIAAHAKDEKEAMSAVFDYEWHREVLDVRVSDELEWNAETIKSYWKWYGIPTGNIETEVRLF